VKVPRKQNILARIFFYQAQRTVSQRGVLDRSCSAIWKDSNRFRMELSRDWGATAEWHRTWWEPAKPWSIRRTCFSCRQVHIGSGTRIPLVCGVGGRCARHRPI